MESTQQQVDKFSHQYNKLKVDKIANIRSTPMQIEEQCLNLAQLILKPGDSCILVGDDFAEDSAVPLKQHMMIKHLIDIGLVSDVFTESTDGLLIKSGIPPKKVHEFFGSKFSLACEKCKQIYYNSKEVTKDEGVCQKMIVETKNGEKSVSKCNGKLKRTLSDKFNEEKQNSALFAAM